jgi:hypothetical protein
MVRLRSKLESQLQRRKLQQLLNHFLKSQTIPERMFYRILKAENSVNLKIN